MRLLDECSRAPHAPSVAARVGYQCAGTTRRRLRRMAEQGALDATSSRPRRRPCPTAAADSMWVGGGVPVGTDDQELLVIERTTDGAATSLMPVRFVDGAWQVGPAVPDGLLRTGWHGVQEIALVERLTQLVVSSPSLGAGAVDKLRSTQMR